MSYSIVKRGLRSVGNIEKEKAIAMYAYKDKYTLDFSNVQCYNEIHRIIKEELELPSYYGENWDALWDCLTDMVGDGAPINIEIIGAEVLEQKFHGTLDVILEILKDIKHWDDDRYRNFVKIEIVTDDKRYEIS